MNQITKENTYLEGKITSSNPLVSIIVITYNSSKYVLETLESAKAQTYRNIELILSDDCSTDNTLEICRKWLGNNKTRFTRVDSISFSENTGIPANCNRGLKSAQGEWVKFIAGDDILKQNCIEDLLTFSISKQASISTSALEEFCDDKLPNRLNYLGYLEQIKFFKKPHKNQFKAYVRNPLFLNSPALFISKEVYEKIGGYDESLRMLEDQPFLIKALKAGFFIHYLDKETVKYRTSHKSSDRIGGQIEDYYLCFRRYRLPELNKFNVLDIIVLYDFYLANKFKNAKTGFMVLVLRVLYNLTNIVYIRKKYLGLLNLGIRKRMFCCQ